MKQTFDQPYAIRVKPITMPAKTPSEPQGRDTFQTPNYAIDLLIPFIPKNVDVVWECAAGGGKIVQRLTENGYSVFPSDIRVSEQFPDSSYYNFVLGDETGAIPYPIWESFQVRNVAIITNPPFSLKDEFVETAFKLKVPFAFLINADYSGQSIEWVRRGCEKIIPTSRIAYITPNVINRINEGEGTKFEYLYEIPQILLYKYSSAQFHSMWLTFGFNLGRTETFVDLTVEQRKTNI